MVSLSVRYLFYQPVDEKIKTWTLCFPAKENLNRWFSRYIIAAMLVDGKQKIAHWLALFIHQHLFISPLLFVSPGIA